MKYFVIAALVASTLAGCASENPSRPVYDRTAHVWRSPEGTYAKDPVSGERVDVNSAITRTHRGDTYYFANQRDAQAFDRDPDRYAYSRIPEESDYPVSR